MQTRISSIFHVFILLPAFLACSVTVHAHKPSAASLILYVETKEERTFKVSVQVDVVSSGDAALDDEIGPEEAAKIFVETQLLVLIDEKEQPLNITSELVKSTDEETPEELEQLKVLVNWTGTLPDNSKDIALYLKETSEMSIMVVTVKNGIPARRIQVMFAGEYSRAENIEPIMEGNPFDQVEPAKEKKKADEPEKAESSDFVNHFKTGARATLFSTALPLCLLFALVILKGSFKALIVPFAVFAVAQSIGVSLFAMGVIPAFAHASTVCIAVMILLAVDNLFSFKFRWWRYIAGAAGGFFLGSLVAKSGELLSLVGTPVDLKSFVSFQLGFDLALLAAALVFGLIIKWFGRFRQFRNSVVIPASLLIAGVAVFLFIQK